MKKLLIILTLITICTNTIQADEQTNKNDFRKASIAKQERIKNFLNEELNLSEDQQKILKKNRIQLRQEMSPIIKKMQNLHDEIKNIYSSNIPKIQADLKTAPLKAELVILKQKANKLRLEHRKNFENALTNEQKIKFKAFKNEMKSRNKIETNSN